ncbi:MAG: TRAP transporter small permease [Caenispirillum bisanense]|nr:TRAP transporter small permease [Caenispirillum bisanense]MCA1972970.1 TRAP transporter small permease [Caenispirillum sp.]
MRKALDTLYLASGVLAALFLVAITLVVLAQVGANIIGKVNQWVTGEPLGLVVPSYADFTGWFLAASSFLALAYTLRAGSHIRVELLIQGARPRLRRLIELWCCGMGLVASGYFAYWAGSLTWESWSFGDVSFGMVAMPLWIPQSGMTLGLIVLTVSFADEVVRILRGDMPSFDAKEADLADSFDDTPADR